MTVWQRRKGTTWILSISRIICWNSLQALACAFVLSEGLCDISSLTDQLLFLQEDDFLQEQFLLDDFIVVCWAQVVNAITENGFISWQSRNDDQCDGDDQEYLQLNDIY